MTVSAAERARQYRARRRERDANVTQRAPELAVVLGELLDEIRALRRDIHRSSPIVDTAPSRDANGPSRSERDVTKRHGGESAPAPARVGARLSGPTGPREPLANQRDVTPIILDALRAAPAPPSAAALADALDLPAGAVLGVLVDLTRGGLVRRIAGETARDRDRWAPSAPAESLGETIACRDYRGHQLSGHRRDPASGHFRCYVCDPDAIAVSM